MDDLDAQALDLALICKVVSLECEETGLGREKNLTPAPIFQGCLH